MSTNKEEVQAEINDWLALWDQPERFEEIAQKLIDIRTFLDRQVGGMPRTLHTQIILVRIAQAKQNLEELEVIVKKLGGIK